MSTDDIIKKWTEQKKAIPKFDAFDDNVMNRINESGQTYSRAGFDCYGILEFFNNRPAARAAVLVAGVLAGLFRFVLTDLVVLG